MRISSDRVSAMDSLRGVCDRVGLSHDQCFAYSRFYINFEGDKVHSCTVTEFNNMLDILSTRGC